MITGISGARGRVGIDFTPEVCKEMAANFGSLLPAGAVVVGRDSRPSGKVAFQAVAAGLTATGHPVVGLGITPTPVVEFAVPYLSASGGVIITASHNPAEWNGLKFLDKDGLFLAPEVGKKVYHTSRNTSFENDLAEAAFPECSRERDALLGAYLKKLRGLVTTAAINRKGFRIVVDAVNGASGQLVCQFLEDLGVKTFPLYCELSGLFPHPPEPRPEHLTELCRKVKEMKADVGFALDPDGDRLALVSEKGEAISEEFTLALCVDFVLSHHPGPVVINLATSLTTEKIARKYNVPVYRTPVGEFYVARKMIEVAAVIGGEGNGGVIYPKAHPNRDGLVAAGLILSLLAEKEQTLSSLVANYPHYYLLKEKAALPPYPAPEIEKRLKRVFPSELFDLQDGVRISSQNWWVQVRFSNTEPIIRIFAEAAEQSTAQALIEKVQAALAAE